MSLKYILKIFMKSDFKEVFEIQNWPRLHWNWYWIWKILSLSRKWVIMYLNKIKFQRILGDRWLSDSRLLINKNQIFSTKNSYKGLVIRLDTKSPLDLISSRHFQKEWSYKQPLLEWKFEVRYYKEPNLEKRLFAGSLIEVL